MHDRSCAIGTAGWRVPTGHGTESGTHLERYARVFSAVEINSSFYRHHRPDSYRRWAASVRDDFRFAVKMIRSITHENRLRAVDDGLERFLAEVNCLGDRLGPLLVQLPPSLDCNLKHADAFFSLLRDRFAGDVVCEPRHASWFDAQADRMLAGWQVARVAADPAIVPAAAAPGGWDGLAYYRLHGSPVMYRSAYDAAALARLAARLRSAPRSWCVFDNTADDAAFTDARALQELMRQ